MPIRWTTEITEWNPPHGPYALWNHEHFFVAQNGGTTMRDHVSYALPFGPIGRLAHRIVVQRDVERLFDFRADAMRRLFPAK
jgi:ligand-binding SRPBCC domain-containing protein